MPYDQSSNNSLLVVENDAVARIELECILTDAGFAPIIVACGDLALAELGEDARRFCAVLTSTRLSAGPDGWDVGRRARALVRDMPIIYLGSGNLDWASNGVPDSILLLEPFTSAQLLAAVGTLLERTVHKGSVEPAGRPRQPGDFRASGAAETTDLGAMVLSQTELTAATGMLSALPVAVYTTDSEGRLTFYNDAAAALWDCKPEIGSSRWCGSWKLFWPDGRPLAHEDCSMWVALRAGQPAHGLEAVAERPDGTRVPFRPYPSLLKDAEGRVTGAINLLVELTEQKRSAVVAEQLAAIVSSSDDAIISKTLDSRITSWNTGATRIFGYEPEEMIGQSILRLIPSNLQHEEDEILSRLRRGERIEHFDTVRLTKDGRRIDISLTVSPVRDGSGTIVGASKVARDVSDRKRQEEELRRSREAAEVMARRDGLTGLLNRPAFREQLETDLKQASSESHTAVLFLDLDEFKSVNDSLGHPAGDQLLIQVGERLRGCLRGTDQVARFGGDEFAIIQTSVKEPEQIERQAMRIIETLNQPYEMAGQEVVVGVSIGVALAEQPNVRADDLLKRADIALYEAKRAGRGVYRFFENGMDEAAGERQRLRAELREAVTRGEFRVHYQPIVELETSRVTSFEALVRWQHPRRGFLSPIEFISLAEATGDIGKMGAWVLREACAMAATWPEKISISVNLSPSQIRASGLMDAVSKALLSSGLPAWRLQLEITETVLLQDDEVVRETLEGLRALGVRISIDDFGTGYSSLGYLRRFSVDNIKIDRSFVADLAENPRASVILSALQVLSEGLGISLTAEGIETVTQLNKLRAIGCRQGQGYFFSHPMSADAVKAFLFEGWESSSPGNERVLGSPRLSATH